MFLIPITNNEFVKTYVRNTKITPEMKSKTKEE